MKIKNVLPTSFTIYFILLSNIMNSQYISTVTYSPSNPVSGDTVKIYGSTTYPMFGCTVTSKSTYTAPINNYMLKSMRCIGYLTTTCDVVDTFKIKLPTNGLYYFHYMPGIDTSGICFKIPSYVYPSAIKTITIQVGAVGIKENINNSNSFLIYPNPFTDKLIVDNITLNTTDKKKLIITNLLGQIIYQTEFYQNNYSEDLSHLPSGVYMAQLFLNGSFSHRTKLIKE